MSDLTYTRSGGWVGKASRLARGRGQESSFFRAARVEAGYLLRRLQEGKSLGLPHSRPMPSIGPRCHELRILDERDTWRVVYRTDSDAIVILEVFSKKARQMPKRVVEACKKRLKLYDEAK